MNSVNWDHLWVEIHLQVQRSRGPGGQNVNKRNTSVQIWWNVDDSQIFDEEQKARIKSKLASFMTEEGALIVRSDTHRELEMNKKAAVGRLVQMLTKALHVDKARKKTKKTYSTKLKNRKSKQKDSEKKSFRRKVDWE